MTHNNIESHKKAALQALCERCISGKTTEGFKLTPQSF